MVGIAVKMYSYYGAGKENLKTENPLRSHEGVLLWQLEEEVDLLYSTNILRSKCRLYAFHHYASHHYW